MGTIEEVLHLETLNSCDYKRGVNGCKTMGNWMRRITHLMSKSHEK